MTLSKSSTPKFVFSPRAPKHKDWHVMHFMKTIFYGFNPIQFTLWIGAQGKHKLGVEDLLPYVVALA